MGKFVVVASESALAAGRARVFEVGAHTVAVFALGGRVHALEDVCPHAGGPLSEGRVEGGTVTCPWHGARFEIATGASVGELRCPDVRCHRVRVSGGSVEIEEP